MTQENFQPYLFFLASLVFSYSFLLVLVNGYEQYTSLVLLEEGREDLIVRLGFIAFATGVLYYPLVLIPVLLLTWLSKKHQRLAGSAVWFYSLMAVLLVGALYYTHRLDVFLAPRRASWELGIVGMILATALYWNTLIRKKVRTGYSS
ncbi:hypothetical protein SAMN05421823_108209 [Catalinimonas alkaloidigena]|uniref:Uncharacterized protein n=1 Tax=Catalinimonas alkaloidigena TaxID=1075417 RepID=A0A1G9N856_9BACT|nr:hypothetical protein [Catalinimonas alkaloidigena]SDL82614.1 hypothetical protein SAMN05421823_108209 [Catalinimonas alkaloidigena]